MNELRNTLAPFQITQAESYYDWKGSEINIENVEPERPEWGVCSKPSKWTPANWKWFLEVSGKITVHLRCTVD